MYISRIGYSYTWASQGDVFIVSDDEYQLGIHSISYMNFATYLDAYHTCRFFFSKLQYNTGMQIREEMLLALWSSNYVVVLKMFLKFIVLLKLIISTWSQY